MGPDPHSRWFGLSDDEQPSAGVRRLALERLEHARAQLDPAAEGDIAKRVHEARKDLKKLRAVLRLVRAEAGDDFYRSENSRLRDAARALSSARDAEVKIATLDGLREHYPEEFPPRGADRYRRALVAERDRHEAALRAGGARFESPRTALAASERAFAAMPSMTDGWDLVGPGLERAYRDGRRLFDLAAREPADENVHEWRKRVKDLTYQARILNGIWEPEMSGLAERTKELSDLLGDHNDLAVLADDLRARTDVITAPMAGRVIVLAERRRAELLADAIHLGERVYAERPKAFRRRMRAYWRTWRTEAV